MEGLSRLICRFIGLPDDVVRCYKNLVGARHSRTRGQLGTGGAQAFTADPERWKAATILGSLRWHQRVQCSNDGTEEAPFTLRSTSGTK